MTRLCGIYNCEDHFTFSYKVLKTILALVLYLLIRYFKLAECQILTNLNGERMLQSYLASSQYHKCNIQHESSLRLHKKDHAN